MLTTRTRPARSVVEKQKADAGASFLSGVVALVDTFADGGEVNTTSTYQDLLKQMGAKACTGSFCSRLTYSVADRCEVAKA